MKRKNSSKGSAVVRYRNFATIVYLDSAPNNWKQIIQEMKIPCIISPFHDKDLNPDLTPKKPHYHVMFCFEGPKSVAQAVELFKKFNGVGCETVESLRGMARYFCHLDNPEKHLYPTDQVVTYSGIDYWECINLVTDKYKIIKQIMAFCEDKNIYSYRKLANYCSVYNYEWFRVMVDGGNSFIKEFLKSRFKDDFVYNNLEKNKPVKAVFLEQVDMDIPDNKVE